MCYNKKMEKENIVIKRMSPDDIDRIISIEQESYGDHHWSRESFLQELNNELAWYYSLFSSDGELAGYAGSWHILDEAHITNIAISKKYRRRKYGEALLRRIIDDCYKEEVKYITLEVRVSNEPAIRLYSKYGFSSLGARKKYYQDNNEDALIMWTKNIFYDEYKKIYSNVVEKLERDLIVK